MEIEEVALSSPVGASVWEREMFSFLTDHVRLESAMLADYVATAEATESKALSYVMNLLVEDERRHHRYFNELASSLKSEAELSGVEPVIPRLDLDRIGRADLLAATKELLEQEKSDITELKRLRKQLQDVKDTTLWGLLVDIMLRDTEKHIAILKFVEHHAKPK